jgi:hypothetical protein
MALKIGTKVFLRTTEEPAFLLDIREGNATQRFPGLSGKVAVVRRPTAGDNGVRHEVEYFAIEEVESEEDARTRQIESMAEMQARFKNNEQIPQPTSAQGKLGLLD